MEPYLKMRIWDNDTNVGSNDLELKIDTIVAKNVDRLGGPVKDHLMLNVQTGYQLKMNDKFYFCPGVAVPRVKLKDLASSHKAKTVRELDVATAIFIGNKTYDVITDYSWQNFVETDVLKKFLEDAYLAGDITDYYYDKFKTATEFYTTENILIDYSTARILRNSNYKYHVGKSDQLDDGSQRTITVKEEYVDFYMELLDKPVYMEEELYPYLNGPDATVIDENMYDALKDMFESSDNDNTVLAMEIMANCDWDKSIMYLAFLLEEFAGTIYNQRSRTHVNFKSFLSYMGRTPSNINIDKNYIFDLIIGKGLLTKDIAQTVLEKYADEVYVINSKYFKVKTVSLSEKIDKLLGEEVLLETKSLDTDEYDD